MTNMQDVQTLIGRTAVDNEGNKIGKVGQVYLDDETGQPQWVTITTGMFGTKQSFAPLYSSHIADDELVLAVSNDLVKDAPSVEDDGHIEQSESDALFQHYAGYFGPTGAQADTGGDGLQGRDTSGPTTDAAMTRSEEQLHVGVQSVEAGKARLRKYVVTEEVSQTVPLRHEEVRLEREPITDANRDAAMTGVDISEEEHEITLHAERPIVAKETVPVERVRLSTETVTEQHEVNETLRKEQIDESGIEAERTLPPTR